MQQEDFDSIIVALQSPRIAIKDRYSSYIWANEEFLKDSGLESCEQILWLSDYDLPWVNQAGQLIKEDQDILCGRAVNVTSVHTIEVSHKNQNSIAMIKYPITSNEGIIIGVICLYWIDN